VFIQEVSLKTIPVVAGLVEKNLLVLKYLAMQMGIGNLQNVYDPRNGEILQ
jgi:hypothetical protein